MARWLVVCLVLFGLLDSCAPFLAAAAPASCSDSGPSSRCKSQIAKKDGKYKIDVSTYKPLAYSAQDAGCVAKLSESSTATATAKKLSSYAGDIDWTGDFEEDFNDGKFESVIVMAGVPIVLTVLLIVVYLGLLCTQCICRKCWSKCKCAKAMRGANHKMATLLLLALYVVPGLTVIAVLKGRNDFNSGIDELAQSVGQIGDIMGRLADNGACMTNQATVYTTNAQTLANEMALCTDPDTAASIQKITDEASNYKDAIKDLNGYWEGQEEEFRDTAKEIKDNGFWFIQIATLVLVLLVVLVAVIGGVASGLSLNEKKPARAICLLNSSGCVILLVVLLIGIVTGVTLLISVLVGSMCASDLDTVLTNAIKSGGSAAISDTRTRDMITDFMKCDGGGESPLTEPIKTAIRGTNAIIDAMTELESTTTSIINAQAALNPALAALNPCNLDSSVNQAIKNIRAAAAQSATSMIVVGEEVCCVTVTPVYRGAMHAGLCNHVLEGLYTIWAVCAAVGVLLFVNLFFAFCYKPSLYKVKGGSQGKQQKGNLPSDRKSSNTFAAPSGNQVAPQPEATGAMAAPAAVPAAAVAVAQPQPQQQDQW